MVSGTSEKKHDNGSSFLIEKSNEQSKGTDSEKREISNIENIYKKVFGKQSKSLNDAEEFSNFSKNFQTNAPKPKSNLDDFLCMFQQEKVDPSAIDETKEEEDLIAVGDYVYYDKDQIMRIEAYYATRQTQIKGTLSVYSRYILFEPLNCEENNMVIYF